MIRSFQDKYPRISKGVYIAESAEVIGDVTLRKGCSVWPGAVLRGDLSPITIGKGSSVQDNSVLHSDPAIPTVIGERVTLGHRVIVHSAHVASNVIIGMGAILLNRAKIGSHSIVAAGAVVLENQAIPPKSLAAGVPAKVLKTLHPVDIKRIKKNATHYIRLAKQYLENTSDS